MPLRTWCFVLFLPGSLKGLVRSNDSSTDCQRFDDVLKGISCLSWVALIWLGWPGWAGLAWLAWLASGVAWAALAAPSDL